MKVAIYMRFANAEAFNGCKTLKSQNNRRDSIFDLRSVIDIYKIWKMLIRDCDRKFKTKEVYL